MTSCYMVGEHIGGMLGDESGSEFFSNCAKAHDAHGLQGIELLISVDPAKLCEDVEQGQGDDKDEEEDSGDDDDDELWADENEDDDDDDDGSSDRKRVENLLRQSKLFRAMNQQMNQIGNSASQLANQRSMAFGDYLKGQQCKDEDDPLCQTNSLIQGMHYLTAETSQPLGGLMGDGIASISIMAGLGGD